ncbi:hypothetical protein KQI82_02060 [Oscillibacter sp. MSJ-2]|uniref:DUF202 domain-containing protein n=1 Tax=Dysosmobacter acutus TaxID=2841504 RepID=A0ABS6F7Z7_9FIRM|nr:hypothetical protein [Dysosmobacter acutus]MBU5625717.1 hypothetical protein [Dysosmobacter acutus]
MTAAREGAVFLEESDSGLLSQAVSTLNQSRHYLIFIIAAVLISYGVLWQQKRQLICGESDPQALFPYQVLSSILTICALVFFFRLSEQGSVQEKDSSLERRLSDVNLTASGLVLAASFMRLWALLEGRQLGGADSADEEVETALT